MNPRNVQEVEPRSRHPRNDMERRCKDIYGVASRDKLLGKLTGEAETEADVITPPAPQHSPLKFSLELPFFLAHDSPLEINSVTLNSKKDTILSILRFNRLLSSFIFSFNTKCRQVSFP